MLAEWLTSIAVWPQLRATAGCRLYMDPKVALRPGRFDPDVLAQPSIKDSMDVVATSKAEPSALPWQDAPLSCKDTIKLVANKWMAPHYASVAPWQGAGSRLCRAGCCASTGPKGCTFRSNVTQHCCKRACYGLRYCKRWPGTANRRRRRRCCCCC